MEIKNFYKRVKVMTIIMAMLPFYSYANSLQGDVDGNGIVNISDVTSLIDYLLNGDETGLNLVDADIDNDGLLTIRDVTGLIDLLLGPNVETHNETFVINGVSFTMIYVEGGTFAMGEETEVFASPVHDVTLSDYMIGETEVTQELWLAVMGYNPSFYCSTEGYEENLQRPVECIRWNDCQDFIAKLNNCTGRNFRLPTEAEWEFAARGGNKSHNYLFSGSNNLVEVGWVWENIPSQDLYNESGTQPVGLKKPNELGICDMSGNVWEFCQDWFAGYSADPQVNPTGPETGTYRVMRGGAFNNSSIGDVSCCVYARMPGGGLNSTKGFRIALPL